MLSGRIDYRIPLSRFPAQALRILLAILALLALTFGALPGSALADSPSVQVVASGLDNPRGLAFGPEGALYVAEAGRGGSGPCITAPEGGQMCYGATGAVTRIWKGSQQRVATGLPSLISSPGGPLPFREALGPVDVSLLGRGDARVVVGLGANPAVRASLGSAGMYLGHLLQLPASGKWRDRVDVSAYEATANPDGGAIDSNPYSVLQEPGATIIADAGANALLRVDANGKVSTLAVFPDRMVPAPPFLGLPPGTEIPMEAVPTSVAKGPDGAYYVGQLTGFPFLSGAANVYRVVPGQAPTVYASGFTNIVGIDFAPDGSLYVVEIATNSLLNTIFTGDLTGGLKRVAPGGGSVTTVMTTGLTAPGGVAVAADGSVYVTNKSVFVGTGEVLRITP